MLAVIQLISGVIIAVTVICINIYAWYLVLNYRFYVFNIGFSVVNLRKIQKEAAGPGPGRTWAGPGRGRRLFLDFSFFLTGFCVNRYLEKPSLSSMFKIKCYRQNDRSGRVIIPWFS